MKLVALLSIICLAAAAPAPWGDDSFEHKYVDKHGRVVEVEYERVPWIGKIQTAATGTGVAAVRAATSVGGLTHQVPARLVLDIDEDDIIVQRGGKFELAGGPLLKATRPDGTNIYLDGSGEPLYTLDDKNNLVPLHGNHPLLKSAANGQQPFLVKDSIEMLGGMSAEVVYSPHTKPYGGASPVQGASKDAVIIAKK